MALETKWVNRAASHPGQGQGHPATEDRLPRRGRLGLALHRRDRFRLLGLEDQRLEVQVKVKVNMSLCQGQDK